jgi:hypothetical protein
MPGFGFDAGHREVPTQVLMQTPAQAFSAYSDGGGSGGGTMKVLVGILAAFLVLLLIVAAGLGVYLASRNDSKAEQASANVEKEKPKSNSDDRSKALEEEADRLEAERLRLEAEKAQMNKMMKQQQQQQAARLQSFPAYVTVNSPRDGFLALRSEPSAAVGFRVAAIPHNSQIMLEGCQPQPPGARWCRASYGGLSGWVFDQYVRY